MADSDSKEAPRGEESEAKGEAQGTEPDKHATQLDKGASVTNMENVTPGTDGGEPSLPLPLACEGRSQASNRWTREGRRSEVEAFRDQVRAECTAAGMTRAAARDHAWIRAIAEFPPPGVEPVFEEPAAPQPEIAAPEPESSGLVGLGDIPADWPDLPDNAALATEVSWVQANRVRVRVGDSVDLSKARSPAPSWATLSWLETSVLFPSKWADITAKATSTQADERESVRRERVSIEEARGLLAEMLEAQEPST